MNRPSNGHLKAVDGPACGLVEEAALAGADAPCRGLVQMGANVGEPGEPEGWASRRLIGLAVWARLWGTDPGTCAKKSWPLPRGVSG